MSISYQFYHFASIVSDPSARFQKSATSSMTQIIEHNRIQLDQQYFSQLIDEFRMHEESLAVPYLESRIHLSETTLEGNQLSVSNIRISPNYAEELKQVCTEIANKQKMLLGILQKSSMLNPRQKNNNIPPSLQIIIVETFYQAKENFSQQTEKMRSQGILIQMLREELQQTKQSLQYTQEAEDEAVSQLHELQTKLEQSERRFDQFEKYFVREQADKDKEQEKQELSQSQKEICILMTQNENLTHLLSTTKSNKPQLIDIVQQSSLLDRIDEADKSVKEYKELIEVLKDQLQQAAQKISSLQLSLAEKEQEIVDMLGRQANGRNMMAGNNAGSAVRSGYDDNKQSHINKPSLNLKEDLNGSRVSLESSLFFVYPEKGIRKLSANNEEEQKNQEMKLLQVKRDIYIDPYYAHYVLTSQSVKIKEDKDEYLGLDMKPFYNEIIEKRIPMHLWDQWIKNKLKEIAVLEQVQHE